MNLKILTIFIFFIALDVVLDIPVAFDIPVANENLKSFSKTQRIHEHVDLELDLEETEPETIDNGDSSSVVENDDKEDDDCSKTLRTCVNYTAIDQECYSPWVGFMDCTRYRNF